MDALQLELVQLGNVLRLVLEVVLAALLDLVETHEDEVEVQRGGDGGGQVEGQQLGLGLLGLDQQVDVSEGL